MSSSSFIASLDFASEQIIIYTGIPIFIAGIVGGVLSFIVFLSLRTFRQSSGAFYLTIMSFVNIGELVAGLLSRIIITMTNVDWTQLSLFYCKFRPYLLNTCTIISLMCLCLATIDQYLATCSRQRWQQWSNIRLAHHFSAVLVVIGLLSGIPHLIYYTQTVSSTTRRVTCSDTNTIFAMAFLYFYQFTLGSILPLIVTILFGLLAYYNVRQLAYRIVPLVRRELDKQLTVMILVQDICIIATILPNTFLSFLSLNPSISQDIIARAQLKLAGVVTSMLYYVYFAVSKTDILLSIN